MPLLSYHVRTHPAVFGANVPASQDVCTESRERAEYRGIPEKCTQALYCLAYLRLNCCTDMVIPYELEIGNAVKCEKPHIVTRSWPSQGEQRRQQQKSTHLLNRKLCVRCLVSLVPPKQCCPLSFVCTDDLPSLELFG